jgi:PKD repeat protein
MIILFSEKSNGQPPCPTVTVNATATPSTVCSGNNSQLNAVASGSGCTYTASAISFAPISGAGTTVALVDDQQSGAINIGFTFSFYCTNYTTLYICSNGFIEMATDNSVSWTPVVSPNVAVPNTFLAPSWCDLYPLHSGVGAGTVDYFTSGVTPNRIFVIRYAGVAEFPNSTPAFTGEALLYETSNVIEFHITSIALTAHSMLEGVENSTGTVGTSVPGRNLIANPNFSNDAWRFTPSGATYTYSWSPTTFLSNANISNPVATGVTSMTTYTVTATDGNNCTGTTTVTVTVDNPVATITPNGSTSFCTGGNVTLTANSGSSYLWSDGEVTQSIVVSSSGTYTVTVTDGTGCTATSSSVTVTVTAPPTPTITPSGTTTFCTGGSVTLTSTAGSSYLWSDGETTQSIVVTTSGTYTVTLTDGNGCVGTSSSVTVTVTPPSTPTITASGATTFCAGGSVTLTSSSGVSYLWSTGAITQSIVVTTSGSYTVAVTSGPGCTGTSSATVVTVNPVPTPTITASGPITFCTGGSVTLTSTAGSSYLWSDGETTQSIVVTTSGTYTVSLTDGNGCVGTSSSVTVTVNPPPTPVITPSGATTFCAGGSVTLTSNAGNSYLWSTGAVTQSILVTTSGNYSVTVTNGVGCTGASSVTVVTVNSLPTPMITAGGPLTFCAGGNVTLTSSAGNSYLWSTGAITQSIVVSTSGSYTVAITDGNGCTGTSVATVVTVNPLPTPTITASGPITFCTGGSVTLTSTAGSSYLWSDGETTQNIVVTTSGTYTVTLTNGNGCVGTSASVTVTVNTAPVVTITAGGPLTFCQGGSVTLTSSAGNSYLWSTGAVTQSINVTTSGNYSVTVSNGAGCTGASSVTTVTVNPLPTPTITASGPTTFCAGGSVTLTSSAGSSYLWSDFETTQSIIVTNTGTYFVFLTDANGCVGISASVTITVNSLPNPTITASGPLTFCTGGSVTLTSTAGSSYLWSDGETTQSIVVTTSGTYTVTLTNGNGCVGTSASTTVTVNSSPIVTITPGGPLTFCQGGNVTLTATAGSSYLWNTGAVTQSIVVSTSGNYSVTVTSGAGCTGASSITTVTVNPLPNPTITASGPLTFCNGGSVTLTSTAGSSYLWSDGEVTQSITVSSSGTYTVTLTDGNGCVGTSASTTVTVNPNPVVTISASGPVTFCQGGNVTLTSTAGSSYLWSTGAISQSIVVSTSGNYSVTVTSGAGCTGASSVTTVTVNPLPNPTITASGPTTFCQGGSVTLTSSNGSSYLWSDGEVTQSIIVTTSGTYTVTLTDGNGCVGTSALITVTVNASPAVTISANGPTVFCQGGGVILTSSAGFSYQWSTGAVSQSILVTTSGNYSVTLTNGFGCTGASSSTTVTVNPLPTPTITASGPLTFCTGGSVTLTSTAGTSYLWSNGATTQSITVNSSGFYSVTLTDGNGCVGTSSVTTVTVNANPVVTISPLGSTTFCQGGSVTLQASAGSTYLWSDGEVTQNINVTTTGSYSVTVTNGAGCTGASSSISVTVNLNPVPVITASGPITFCEGGVVTLTASGGGTYVWSNSATTNAINVISSGTYDVTVTNAFGCFAISAPTTVTVNIPMPANITSSGSTTLCGGGNVTLTANAGSNYLWNTGAVTQSILVSTAGSFDVTVTDVNGCTATSNTINTAIGTTPTATITPDGSTTFCPGDSLLLTSNTESSYLWNTGANSQSIYVTTAGSFTVTVTNSDGCTAVSAPVTTTLGAQPAVITSSGPTTFCEGGNVTLFANNGSGYLWSTGETTESIFVTTAGTYSVTVTYPGNCSAPSGLVTVVINPAPVITIITNPNDNFCIGDSVTLTANAAGAIIWSTSDVTPSITVGDPGIYTASVTDANGCEASSSVTLIGFNFPSAGFTSSTNGNTVDFTNTSTNALTYLWYFGDGNSSNAPNPSHTYLFGNTYTVTLIVTNPCGSDTVIQTIVITGISEIALDNAVSVYPNPTDQIINISLVGFSGKHLNFKITDIVGHTIHNENLEIADNNYLTTFDFATYSKGVYLLIIKTDGGMLTKKIILQ